MTTFNGERFDLLAGNLRKYNDVLSYVARSTVEIRCSVVIDGLDKRVIWEEFGN